MVETVVALSSATSLISSIVSPSRPTTPMVEDEPPSRFTELAGITVYAIESGHGASPLGHGESGALTPRIRTPP